VVAAGARVTVAAGVLIVIYVGANSRIHITRIVGTRIPVIAILVDVAITTLQVEIAGTLGRDTLIIRGTNPIVITDLGSAGLTYPIQADVPFGATVVIAA
jgi:hypothetical protein